MSTYPTKRPTFPACMLRPHDLLNRLNEGVTRWPTWLRLFYFGSQ